LKLKLYLDKFYHKSQGKSMVKLLGETQELSKRSDFRLHSCKLWSFDCRLTGFTYYTSPFKIDLWPLIEEISLIVKNEILDYYHPIDLWIFYMYGWYI